MGRRADEAVDACAGAQLEHEAAGRIRTAEHRKHHAIHGTQGLQHPVDEVGDRRRLGGDGGDAGHRLGPVPFHLGIGGEHPVEVGGDALADARREGAQLRGGHRGDTLEQRLVPVHRRGDVPRTVQPHAAVQQPDVVGGAEGVGDIARTEQPPPMRGALCRELFHLGVRQVDQRRRAGHERPQVALGGDAGGRQARER